MRTVRRAPSALLPSPAMRRVDLIALLMTFAVIGGACGKDAVATHVDTGSPPPSPTKPAVTVPDGPPPTTLVVRDITVGTGPVATAGSTVSVQYVGVAWSTKKQFDASWDRGQPFTFALGQGQVIPGWDQGVVGMRVGGRRELTIPPGLGYGSKGAGPIAPNETLVFVIDLLSVR